MGEPLVGNYYCHVCSQTVIPAAEAEIKCPSCEAAAAGGPAIDGGDDDTGPDRSQSPWAPVQLGTVGPRPRAFADAGAPFGDYFVGPGLEMLLQHLAGGGGASRYGTPPAKREAVDAMPTVAVEESLSCSVCLEDLGGGTGAKEMPCKHKFHGACIRPWLDVHSSCPVCRFRIAADDSKVSSGSGGGDGGGGIGRGLFSSSSSSRPRSDGNSSSDRSSA